MTERRDWRKSSFSGSAEGGGDCVEILGSLNAVRDSKNPLAVLHLPVEAFANAVKLEKFTR